MYTSIIFKFNLHYVLVLCLFSTNIGLSQNSKDSLSKVWSNEKLSDTTRLNAINKIIMSDYQYSNPDSTLYYSKLTYDFAEKKGLKKHQANALSLIGTAFLNQSKYNSALSYYQQSLKLWEELDNDKHTVKTLINIALTYNRLSNYKTSNIYLSKSLELAKKINNQELINEVYGLLGDNYMDIGDYSSAIKNYSSFLIFQQSIRNKKGIANGFIRIANVNDALSEKDKALEYYNKALNIYEDINYKKGISKVLLNLGNLNNGEKSLDYYFKSLKIKEELEDKRGIGKCYINIGVTYHDMNDLNKAFEYYTKSYNVNKEIGNKRSQSTSLINLSDVYLTKRDSATHIGNETFAIQMNNKTKKTASEAFEIANSIGAKDKIKHAAFSLYEYYVYNKDYKKALDYHKTYITARDSLLSEKNQRELYKQQYKYEYEKQAAADKAVAQERINQEKDIRIILYCGLGILLFFIGFIYNRYQKSQKQKQIIETTLLNLKQTQNQLVQSEKMAALGTLTAGIAHEINNPINFIGAGVVALNETFQDFNNGLKNYASINDIKQIEEDYNLNELPEIIESINIGVERTSEIVKGLLLYSHNDNSKPSVANIHKSLDLALTLLKSKYKYSINIIKNYNSNISDIECYPSQLNQVFTNIISNAIDAITKKGTITITTKNKNNNIKITILDTGSGIPDEIKSNIFDPFFTTKKVGSGTGLGLSICQGIISKHNGKISINSSIGKGTEVVIILPIKLN